MVIGMKVIGYIFSLFIVISVSGLNAQASVTTDQVKQVWEKVKVGQVTADDVDLLVLGLKSEDTYSSSVDALAGITSAEAIPFLTKHINDERPDVRAVMVSVLRTFKNKDVVPALIKSMADPAAIVRLNAVEGFLEFSDERAIEPLIKAVDDNDSPDIRSTAIMALSNYRDKRIVPALMIRKSGDAPWLDLQRVQFLGEYKDARAVSSLLVLIRLKGASVQLRKHIVWALGEIGDKRAVPALEEVSQNDEAKEVRLSAVDALRKIQSS